MFNLFAESENKIKEENRREKEEKKDVQNHNQIIRKISVDT